MGSPKLTIDDPDATSIYHSVVVHRTEALASGDTQGAQNAAILANVIANNTSGGGQIRQPVGIKADVTQNGVGDAVGYFAQVDSFSPGYAAIGSFFSVNQNSASGGAQCISTNLANSGGTNHAFTTDGSAGWWFVGVDVVYASPTAANAECGMLFRLNGVGKWDTGIGFADGSCYSYLLKSSHISITPSGGFIASRNDGGYQYELVNTGSNAAHYGFAISNATGHLEWNNLTGAPFNIVTMKNGLVVGPAAGGDKGVGTINISGDIYKNSKAYTNPDYVFEYAYTGKIEKFADSPRATDYKGPVPLNQLREHTRESLRLPGITDEPQGTFARSDLLLEKVEEMALYIMELHERIKALEAAINPASPPRTTDLAG